MNCVSSLGSPKQLCDEFEAVPQGISRDSIYFMFLGHKEQVRFYYVGRASWTWDVWNKNKEEPCYWHLNHCTHLSPIPNVVQHCLFQPTELVSTSSGFHPWRNTTSRDVQTQRWYNLLTTPFITQCHFTVNVL